VQHAQLWRHCHFVQDAVDPVANANVVLERLDVNIVARSTIASRIIWFTNFTTDASGSSELMSVAISPSCKISKSRFD